MADAQEPKLGFKVSLATAEKLAKLQVLVRAAGHGKPGQRAIVSALIHDAHNRLMADDRPDSEIGEEIEATLLVPFRKTYSDEE